MTLWGKQAEQFTAEDHPVIAFRGVKIGDFGGTEKYFFSGNLRLTMCQGRSLSMLSSSTMNINPDIEEAFALRGWYDAIGSEQAFQSHSNAISSMSLSGGFNRAEARNLNDVKESQLGMSDKVDYFSARATIMHIKSENISYPACPTQGCSKKVISTNEGWRCEKCDRSFEKPEHR
jgi:replication factor A1